ncbi:MAG: ABC transporter ATP-binding protein, partial [Planctomycetota bacterium]|nr:ABC transporter ATP-binding protein [Planctomycetota bacterium]
GNHLDVETVEALAQALLAYQGTVIFTSHDRYFMQRIATSVIEVRDGRVRNYSGDYDAYLYAVNKEIDEGERERHRQSGTPTAKAKPVREPSDVGGRRPEQKDQRRARKELSTLEKKIAQLDEQRRTINEQLMQSSNSTEAIRLHHDLETVSQQLHEAEERWLELSQQQ